MGARPAASYPAVMETTPAPRPERVLLVGLNEGLARSLSRCLQADPRFILAGTVCSLGLACILGPLTRPDLAVLDWAGLHDASPEGLRLLRTGYPGLRVACMGSEDGPYRAAAVRAGVDLFVARDRVYEELCSAPAWTRR